MRVGPDEPLQYSQAKQAEDDKQSDDGEGGLFPLGYGEGHWKMASGDMTCGRRSKPSRHR